MSFHDDVKAYADGELPPERMAEISDAIAKDGELRREFEQIQSISYSVQAYSLQVQPVGLDSTLAVLSRRRRSSLWRWIPAVAFAAACTGIVLFLQRPITSTGAVGPDTVAMEERRSSAKVPGTPEAPPAAPAAASDSVSAPSLARGSRNSNIRSVESEKHAERLPGDVPLVANVRSSSDSQSNSVVAKNLGRPVQKTRVEVPSEAQKVYAVDQVEVKGNRSERNSKIGPQTVKSVAPGTIVGGGTGTVLRGGASGGGFGGASDASSAAPGGFGAASPMSFDAPVTLAVNSIGSAKEVIRQIVERQNGRVATAEAVRTGDSSTSQIVIDLPEDRSDAIVAEIQRAFGSGSDKAKREFGARTSVRHPDPTMESNFSPSKSESNRPVSESKAAQAKFPSHLSVGNTIKATGNMSSATVAQSAASTKAGVESPQAGGGRSFGLPTIEKPRRRRIVLFVVTKPLIGNLKP